MRRPRLRLLVLAETVVDPVDVVCPVLLRWPDAEVRVLARPAWSAALAAATEESWIGLGSLDPALTARLHLAEREAADAHAAEVRHLLRRWGVTAAVEVVRSADERAVVRAAAGNEAEPRPDLVAPAELRRRVRHRRRARRLRALSVRTGVPVVDLGLAGAARHPRHCSGGRPA
jgi:hypothetical protein